MTFFNSTLALVLAVSMITPISTFNIPNVNNTMITSPTEKCGGLSETLVSNSFNADVSLYTLADGSDMYGHTIWLHRKTQRVKAKYFAFKEGGKTVTQRYNEWKKGKKVILNCSGAFTTGDADTAVPEGLTIDNGNMVNKLISDKMDGLVIVEAVGGVRVTDLDSGALYLLNIKKTVDLKNAIDRQAFIDWADDEDATVFQTQLMYYKNVKKHGSTPQVRERRMYVLAKNSNGDVEHIIVNVTKQVSLTVLSEKLFDYFHKTKGLEVIAVLNLDTGTYDILNVFEESGTQLSAPKGPRVISEATNLVAYYYE